MTSLGGGDSMAGGGMTSGGIAAEGMDVPMDSSAAMDGNVLAGAFAEMFGSDMTAARGRCANCGRMGPVAETVVYGQAVGLVARCPGCGSVLMTVVRADDRAYLSLHGLSFLEMPVGAPAT